MLLPLWNFHFPLLEAGVEGTFQPTQKQGFPPFLIVQMLHAPRGPHSEMGVKEQGRVGGAPSQGTHAPRWVSGCVS